MQYANKNFSPHNILNIRKIKHFLKISQKHNNLITRLLHFSYNHPNYNLKPHKNDRLSKNIKKEPMTYKFQSTQHHQTKNINQKQATKRIHGVIFGLSSGHIRVIFGSYSGSSGTPDQKTLKNIDSAPITQTFNPRLPSTINKQP